MKLIITRTKEDNQSLKKLALARNIESFDFPCLEFVPPQDNYIKLDESIRKNHHYDWLFFLSRKAADVYFSRILELGGQFFHLSPHLKIACVGPATKDFIKEQIGFPVNFMPTEFNSKTLAKEFIEKFVDAKPLPGQEKIKVVLPRNEVADDSFIKELEASGQIEVELCGAYDVKCPDDNDLIGLKNLLDSGEQVYISFASSETVRNFKKLIQDLDLSTYENMRVLSIGPKTSSTIKELFPGLSLSEASESTLESMLDSMIIEV